MISSSSRRCSTRLHLLPSGKNCPRYAFASRVPKLPTSLSAPKTRANKKLARSWRFRHAKPDPQKSTIRIDLWYQHNCLPSPICSRLSTSTLLVSRVQLAYRILKRKDFRHHLSYGPMRRDLASTCSTSFRIASYPLSFSVAALRPPPSATIG